MFSTIFISLKKGNSLQTAIPYTVKFSRQKTFMCAVVNRYLRKKLSRTKIKTFVNFARDY